MRRAHTLAREVLTGETVTTESATMALAVKREVECARGLRCDWSWDRDAG